MFHQKENVKDRVEYINKYLCVCILEVFVQSNSQKPDDLSTMVRLGIFIYLLRGLVPVHVSDGHTLGGLCTTPTAV